MAKKTHKKPRHTSLVVPGVDSSRKKHTYKQDVPAKETAKERPAAEEDISPPAAKAAKPAATKARAGRKDNTIRIDPALIKARRRRIWRKVRTGLLLALVIWIAFFFASGTYLNVWVSLSETAVNAQVAMNSGNGFPLDFAMTGVSSAQAMGESAFAVLGESDLAVVSDSGKELMRIQHGFVHPQITTSKNRVCIYDRQGKSYTVEGKTSTFFTGTADNSILFAALSPGGDLALCTASRSQYKVSVYDATLTGDARWSWTSVDDLPISAVFYRDNKMMALGCLSTKDGVTGTRIYIFRTDKDGESAQLASISVGSAIPVQMHFLAGGRLLVLYNQGYAALYNTSGEEQARFDYSGRKLLSADVRDGLCALVFGASEQDSAELTLLNTSLERLCDVVIPEASSIQVLASAASVYVLDGQQVSIYSAQGQLLDTRVFEAKAYSLVWGGEPLVILADSIESLAAAEVEPVAQPPSSASSGTSGASSPSSASQITSSLPTPAP